jgi:glycosyltransferase involved in cell wall biosynthesis
MRFSLFTDSNIYYLDGVARIIQELIEYVRVRPQHALQIFHRDRSRIQRLLLAENVELRNIISPSLQIPHYDAYPLQYLLSPKRRLLRIARGFHPDLLLTVTPYVPWGIGNGALYVARKLCRPLVGSYDLQVGWNSEYHLHRLFRSPLLISFFRWYIATMMRAYARCVLILVPSRAMQDYVRQEHPGIRTVRFPRAVDSRMFSPLHRSEEFRKRYGLGQRIVILFVGRLSLEKNLRTLADIYSRLKAHHPETALLMVGEGPERAVLETRGLPDLVFTGTLRGVELGQAYASADIFAFPSLAEAGPMVILEAMASGLPVVVPHTGGASESVVDRETGFVVQSMEQLEQRLEKLIGDRELRRRMGRRARQFAEEHSWERIWDQVMAALEETA